MVEELAWGIVCDFYGHGTARGLHLHDSALLVGSENQARSLFFARYSRISASPGETSSGPLSRCSELKHAKREAHGVVEPAGQESVPRA